MLLGPQGEGQLSSSNRGRIEPPKSLQLSLCFSRSKVHEISAFKMNEFWDTRRLKKKKEKKQQDSDHFRNSDVHRQRKSIWLTDRIILLILKQKDLSLISQTSFGL